ncbi:hypothetical protein HID58_075951, partial [Brassica napus]
ILLHSITLDSWTGGLTLALWVLFFSTVAVRAPEDTATSEVRSACGYYRVVCSGRLQRRFNSLCSVVVAGSIVTWPAFDLKKILCP